MSPDFLMLPASTTVAQALDAIRTSSVPREALAVVFISSTAGHPIGSVSTVHLIQSPRDAPLSVETTPDLPHTHPDWDLGATVRKMSDFNLTVAPVLDPDHGQILGVITVDDVLELLLPQGWRRDFGVASAGAEE
jgi:Mg/Co/Ni transporter MgtE